ncbi:hypothetical protein M2271_002466 [Streptomyces sp. LBL]|uniref:hypothetical protein n=1 Tax=Streptomyces sp. LBL TaxID=2940562 RepID=UPI00247416D6|nr:hypothetical protein [Streptomyces sp. LBL]MDH6624662.1 hypothetical protein [Streptomyces sp. LBL]
MKGSTHGTTFPQQCVKLVDRTDPGLGQVHTPFVQKSQRRGVVLEFDIPSVSLQIGDGGRGTVVIGHRLGV